MALVDSLPAVQMLKVRHAGYNAYRILRAEGNYADKLRDQYPLGAEIAPFPEPLLPQMCLAAAQALAIENYLNDNRQPWGLAEVYKTRGST